MPSPRAADYPYFDRPFLALAHRGGALLPANQGRENTVHAFQQAADLGYCYFETDVHATSDGVVVAFHDDRLDRVSDRRGRIADLPWSELAEVRIGGLDLVPTLAELLETFPDHRFNIDIKSSGAIVPLTRVINQFSAQDRVCVGSFGIGRIRAFRRLMGTQVATSVAAHGIAWNSMIPVLPRLVNDSGVVLQMPTTWKLAGRRVRLLTRQLVRRAHAVGKHVHVWTIDDADEMNELIDLGVDGLVSDRIDVLREVCVSRGLW